MRNPLFSAKTATALCASPLSVSGPARANGQGIRPKGIPRKPARQGRVAMHRASLFLALLGFTASIVQAATFTVTTTADSGGGSLRQAILDANAASGNDTITFAITGTITLASALPAIADNTTITGPGANLLTTSGNNSVQVFIVNAGTTSTISGLTIANGLATGYANGAGIANSGRLTILDCSFVNNQNLFGWGGAVFNSGRL